MIRTTFFQQMLALSPVLVNWMICGCGSVWISNSLLYLTTPGHEPFATILQFGYFGTIQELGKVVSAIAGGILIKTFGRKPVVIMTGLVNFLAWFGLSVSTSINIIYVTRFLTGLSFGLQMVAAPVIVAEIASAEVRGIFHSASKIAMYVGAFDQSLVSSVFTSYRVIQVTGLIVTITYFPTLCWLIETPTFLMNSNRREKATKHVAKLNPRCSESELNGRITSLANYVQEQARQRVNFISSMTQAYIRKSLVSVISLNMLVLISGRFIVPGYMTYFLPETRHVSKTAYPVICYSGAVVLSIVFSVVIEKFPRRFLYIAAAIFLAVLQLTNAIFCYFAWHQRTECLKWCFIISNFLFIIISDVVIETLNNGVRSELFPPGVKEYANSICVIFRSMTGAFSIFLFNLLNEYHDQYVHYIVFAIFGIILTLVAYETLPETRGVNLEDVEAAITEDKKKGNALH